MLPSVPESQAEFQANATRLYDGDSARSLAERSLDYLAALCLPLVVTLKFPNFYVNLWGLLTKALKRAQDFSKFAIGLPRGHGKTMFIKILCIYIVLFTKRRYIMVIGANLKKAQAIVADIKNMLSENNIITLWGAWTFSIEKNTQDLVKFTFRGRTIIIEAAGYGTAIRGSNQDNQRPDVLIFDDAQTKQCAESLTEAQAFQSWFLGDAMKLKDPKGCTFIYIGNMYKDMELVEGKGIYACMLRNLQNSPEWTSIIVGAILEDMEPLWPDLHPLDNLLAEFRQDLDLGQPEIFFAEVLNDPQAKTSYFLDLTQLKVKDWGLTECYGKFIVIDPATSKRTPDKQAILECSLYDGKPHVDVVHETKLSSPDTVYFVLDLVMKSGASLVVVEDVAYQYALVEWFRHAIELTQMHGLNVVGLTRSGMSKNARIMGMFKDWVKQDITCGPKAFAQAHHQASLFDPRQKDNIDDILDAMEMATQVPARFMHFISIPGIGNNQGFSEFNGLPTQLDEPSQVGF